MEKDAERATLERVSIKNLVWDEPAPLELDSAEFERRTEVQSSQTLMPSRPKKPEDRWLSAEDDLLRAWVTRHGARKWGELSRTEFRSKRTPSQLRARYVDVIDSRRSLASWSAEEDSLLWALQQELGNAWAEIARRLDSGRVPNDVKSRYRLLARRASRSPPAE
mmetsp:Transcript_2681/g.7315  ORF Transcript_2681/g.7315 Transcript_2681/m.7315 type:complete len:165 (-) Transcript_2681:801-1295(-)